MHYYTTIKNYVNASEVVFSININYLILVRPTAIVVRAYCFNTNF